MGRQATYRRAPKRRAVSPGAVRTAKRSSIRSSLPSTIEELIAVEPERLARFDIAWMNLMCATGLPGAGTLDINHFLKKLDEWARHVEKRTQRNLHQFKANPAYYENSEAYFRMLTLTTVLQLDFRVHYNLERIDAADRSDSEDLLIHGLLGPRRTGTCVSLPVLITAIGRRLGYPLKLVKGMAHLFCRWHDQVTRERFNIECHGRGMSCYPDEHYLTWPMEMPADVIKLGVFLTSIGPAEELGCFLAMRGYCLEAVGRLDEARVALETAVRLSPNNPDYAGNLHSLLLKMRTGWEKASGIIKEARNASRKRSSTAAFQTTQQISHVWWRIEAGLPLPFQSRKLILPKNSLVEDEHVLLRSPHSP